MGMKVAYTGPQAAGRAVRYRRRTSTALAAAVGFPGRRVPGRRGDAEHRQRGRARGAGQEGHARSTSRAARSSTSRRSSRALEDGTIKGAGLDVFADEPHIPPALLAMDNVVLLPHVGSATRETRKAMGDLCKANLDAWFAGQQRADADSRTRLKPDRLETRHSGASAQRQSATARRLPGGNSTANSAATTSASASHSCGPGRSPSNSDAGEHADHRHRQRRQRRHRHRQRAREREPRPVRERAGEEDVVGDREPAARRQVREFGRPRLRIEQRREHGERQPARATSSSPTARSAAIGGFHLRSSTVPNAHVIAAPRIISAPSGAFRMMPISSPSSTAIPAAPSARPTSLRRDSGSCSTTAAIIVAQIGIVYARIALRPAGSCCTPNSTSPFQPAMLKNASDTEARPQRARHRDRIAG